MDDIINQPVRDFRLPEVQLFLNTLKTRQTAKNVFEVIKMMYDYAARNDLISAEQAERIKYADLSRLPESQKFRRRVFTRDEIAELWTADDFFSRSVLCLIFTGLRIGEYLALCPEDFKDGCVYVRQSKTAAGVRVVPIADKLRPIFIPENVPRLKYSGYLYHFRNTTKGHTVHDTRHTFISLCADAGIDERITKAIVGHSGSGVTETVYTHLDIDILRNAVNQICY